MPFPKENLHGSLADVFFVLAGVTEIPAVVRVSGSEKQEKGLIPGDQTEL